MLCWRNVLYTRWNYLIYDSHSDDHYTLVYHTSKYAKSSNLESYGSVSMLHRNRGGSVCVANHHIPLSGVQHRGDWSLDYTLPGAQLPIYRQVLIDDDTYRIEGIDRLSSAHQYNA